MGVTGPVTPVLPNDQFAAQPTAVPTDTLNYQMEGGGFWNGLGNNFLHHTGGGGSSALQTSLGINQQTAAMNNHINLMAAQTGQNATNYQLQLALHRAILEGKSDASVQGMQDALTTTVHTLNGKLLEAESPEEMQEIVQAMTALGQTSSMQRAHFTNSYSQGHHQGVQHQFGPIGQTSLSPQLSPVEQGIGNSLTQFGGAMGIGIGGMGGGGGLGMGGLGLGLGLGGLGFGGGFHNPHAVGLPPMGNVDASSATRAEPTFSVPGGFAIPGGV